MHNECAQDAQQVTTYNVIGGLNSLHQHCLCGRGGGEYDDITQEIAYIVCFYSVTHAPYTRFITQLPHTEHLLSSYPQSGTQKLYHAGGTFFGSLNYTTCYTQNIYRVCPQQWICGSYIQYSVIRSYWFAYKVHTHFERAYMIKFVHCSITETSLETSVIIYFNLFNLQSP